MSVVKQKQSKRPLTTLLITLIIPAVILMRFSSEEWLGPTAGLIVALLLPLGYGLYDFRDSRNVNVYSVLGVISVVLTGGIGLLQLDPQVVALKEALVPALIGVVIVVSQKSRWPLVPGMLEQALDMELVTARLQERSMETVYQARLWRATLLIAFSFFFSAVLNYILARMIVRSAPGTVAFNEELGRLTVLSYPAIALPSMIVMLIGLWYLLRGIRLYTDLEIERMLKK